VLEGPLEEIKAHDRDCYILPYQLAFQAVTTAEKRRSPFGLVVALKRTAAAYLATAEGDGEGALRRRRDSGLGGAN